MNYNKENQTAASYESAIDDGISMDSPYYVSPEDWNKNSAAREGNPDLFTRVMWVIASASILLQVLLVAAAIIGAILVVYFMVTGNWSGLLEMFT